MLGMGDRGGQPRGRVGEINFTRQIPNFLAVMGAQQDRTGIAGAVAERERRSSEAEDRPDNDDEKPVIVEDAEAQPSSSKRAHPVVHASGSLRFKGDDGDSSASSRFRESAHSKVMEVQRSASEVQEETRDGGVGARHTFVSVGGPRNDAKKKRKHEGGPAALKNKKLLSFDEDDDGA